MSYDQSRIAITCCKDCTKRYPACSAHCETYQNAKAQMQIDKENYRKQLPPRITQYKLNMGGYRDPSKKEGQKLQLMNPYIYAYGTVTVIE